MGMVAGSNTSLVIHARTVTLECSDDSPAGGGGARDMAALPTGPGIEHRSGRRVGAAAEYSRPVRTDPASGLGFMPSAGAQTLDGPMFAESEHQPL